MKWWSEFKQRKKFLRDYAVLYQSNECRITLKKISSYRSRDSFERTPPEHVTKIEIEIKNHSKSTLFVEYNDFSIFNKTGGSVTFYPYVSDSLGTMIEPGTSITGNIYVVEDIQAISSIYYKS
ncbi:hypothetical protein EXIGUO8H_280002 [Exiguobacterium sp. 8H]|uniref:DUF4352 domain-containing protein n=1 Tax=unclassified Exiguobacterium TaxID=2644629 RepID=UPI0012F0578C|nr:MULTISPECIES: DUF4352 domain-containing protein [unclassified Exiguobacterium]VXB82110.1 hypothetical protein EXIGUO8H_280002 [Exiguobacterium sp. 8H]VXB97453.1 hypothetical protein EXIGUO8A_410003 [Exiguobacterium sp. 8A]